MFQGKVILVVDDEADLREIIRDELRFEGATVYEATNGKEALEQISKRQFDAVLSDIRMPGGDGTTLTKQIRDLSPNHPVIVLITAFADLNCEDAFSIGADGYVSKPFHLQELKASLSRLLQEPEARWKNKPNVKPQKKLKLASSMSEYAKKGQLVMGRGGFFLGVPIEKTHVGDLIEFQFSDLDSMQAQVRWVRTEPAGGSVSGLGLEFFHVPETNFPRLQKLFPDWKSKKSFIPEH